jgi:putative salt-induced outer membrane protein YdiY
VFLAWTATSVWADELKLRNGDRLTGEVVKMEDNVLTFKTDYGGEIKIDWGKVERITAGKPMKVKVPGERKGAISDFFIGGHELRHVMELGPETPIALSDVKGINIEHIRREGTFTLGGNHTSGNTNTQAVNAIARVTLQAHRQRLYLESKYNYGEANGRETARNAMAQIKYDYFLSDKDTYFLNTFGLFEHDRFQSLELRATLGAGLGYQFLNTGRTTLSGTAGLGYVDEDYSNRERTRTPSIHWGWRFEQTLLPRVKIFQRLDGFYDVIGDNAIRITADQGIRVTVYGNLYVSFEYDYRLNTEPAPGRHKVDQSSIFGVGFQF